MTEMKDDRRFHTLTQKQVETLDQVLTEVIPIHGRGNFPTLEIKPKDIIHVVRNRLIFKNIKVRDVRLNGSTASHVLVKENGTSYKDLDIIFGVELPKQEDFQIIKEVVLGCLLDFLPKGVNKDKITALTMKEAYVQKMVKVFTEHDRWSLISLSNNSGKNVELKFVNSLRRQFEFSVDSFQIILDSMLQSYLEAERREFMEQKEKEQEYTSAQRLGIQSAPTDEPSLSTVDLGHHRETDIDMSCETDNMQSFCDCESNMNVSQEEQSKCSEQGPAFETVEKHVGTELVKTTTETMEQISEHEHTETVTLLTETLQEVHKCETGIDSGENNELVTVKSETMSVKEKNPSVETYIPTTDSNKTEYTLDIKSVNAQPWLEMVHTDFSCLSTTGTFGERCTFQPAPITFLTQTALESYGEYPLPPPAKKNSRSSQMVVLKHSSPKPPRKMSKKSTPVPRSPEKSVSNNSDVTSCQVLNPPKANPKESLPMQVKVTGLVTKGFELSSASEKDTESKKLAISTRAFTVTAPENDVHSEETLSISLSPKESAQTQVQSSEPETGEATHIPILTPMTSTNNLPKDQDQPFTERVQTTQCTAMAPLIHVNSQPLLQADDSFHLSLTTSKKKDTDYCAQVDDPASPTNSTQSPEPVTNITNFPSQTLSPLSANYTIDSQGEGTSSSCSEHVQSPQVHIYPVSPLQTQETPVPCPQTKEPPELVTNVLEPPVSSPKVQGLTVSTPHFTKPLEPSISSTASLKSPRISEPLLELTATCLDVMEPFEVSLEVIETSKVLPQVLEPSAVSSPMLETSMPSASQAAIYESSETLASDTKEPSLSSKELPCITVMAESMYGDFEQAMDHLRYRLIATRNPEEIRGGGLLKYSNLLVRDFKPASETEIKTLERYMCSRFFIDFPDVNEQQHKIESYLRNHFIGEEKSKYDYLMTLRRVVNESTVCLMGHERRQTLNMITILALKVLGEQNIIPNANNVTCYYQPAPYMADHNFNNYYIANGQSPLIYHPYPLHIHMQSGLV
ncbi:proteoglycan 4-like [Myxocyprinus asiaticus]|uniref:proteoglycan 4-like n=1 Tax=Myxocyprinus asiaticus TaxID=70543 RepID=UPI002221F539|nr:proteoglycan 4-like [Myxocyprinus asiaticus]